LWVVGWEHGGEIGSGGWAEIGDREISSVEI